jgi:anti-anti-sigma regulatory factor
MSTMTTTIRPDESSNIEKPVLEAIIRVFRERLHCETEEQLGKTCLAVAQELTGAAFGFIGELNAHGRLDTIALSDPGWEACRVPDSDKLLSINDMEVRGLWGLVIQENRSLIIDEPATHPSRVGIPEGHPPLTAFLGAPLRRGREVIGMISLANKPGGFDAVDQTAIDGLSVAIVEALISKRAEEQLSRQAQEIAELSTPVLKISAHAVLAPLIGMLDSERTQQFMERLLRQASEARAIDVLIDITGVPTIDTSTAQHLIETVTAVRLLGARVILTGVRPAIAQTLVHLAIDLSGVETRASLAQGLAMVRQGEELSNAG